MNHAIYQYLIVTTCFNLYTKPWDVSSIIAYHIYVDGSGDDDGAEPTWGLAVFAVYADLTVTAAGYACDVICLDSSQYHFFGASAKHSAVSELTAQIFALLWIIQAPQEVRSLPIFVFYDSIYAASLTSARLVSPALAPIVSVAQALFAVCTILCPDGYLRFNHVKAHTDHPWNTYVDYICTYAKYKPH